MVPEEPHYWPLSRSINIGDMSHTFANFKSVPGAENCLRVFHEMAEGTSATPFAFCYGEVGNGKTHLLEATVIRLNERGLFTRYLTWGDIVNTIRRFIRHTEDEPSANEILERTCRAPRLIIDDLGMGVTDTDWELAQLEAIINYRYRFKLFTAIATNKDIKDLPPRIISRLNDKEVCTKCLNRAPDYRLEKKRR